MGPEHSGRPVVGVDLRCVRAGLNGLAGVGVHSREIFGRLLRDERPPLSIVTFAGSRWRSRAGEALAGFGGLVPRPAASWVPGRVLEGAWRALSWPPLETVMGRADLLHGPDYFLPPHRCERRIYTVHDLAVLRRPEFASDGFRRYFERGIESWRRPGTSFIAVSEFTRAEMGDLLGIPPARVRVVQNGVGPEFRPAAAAGEGRARLLDFRATRNLAGRFLLGVGSIQPRKNLLALLRAVRILRGRAGRTEPLVLCGNQEWLSGAIRAEAEALGPAVRFVSLPRAEMPLLYAAATALAYPSFYEGFGLPILEAMACGTPVAASDAGSHREVAGDAASYFPPEDPDALAACIERLLDDEPLRERLSAAGRARAARFTWERAAEGTHAAYLEALGLGEAAPHRAGSASGERERYVVSG